VSSLETQFGDAGHGASRASLTPRVLGRCPAQEKSDMRMKMIRIAALFL
jgi:hypothetical protein